MSPFNIDLHLTGPLQGVAPSQKSLGEIWETSPLNSSLEFTVPLPNRCHRLSLVVNEGQLKDKLVLG
jgi:hypothetical protein